MAEPVNLKHLIDRVIEEAEKLSLNDKTIFKIRLSLEETFSNIINHAYPDTTGDILVSCFLREQRIFNVEIQDTGIPFNVMEATPPDVSSKIEEREAGGLGIHLIKKSTNDMTYRRVSRHNILNLAFYF